MPKPSCQPADGTGSAAADAAHGSTSSEGDGATAGEQSNGLIESSSFSGEGGSRELERVTGFDESLSAANSDAGQLVPVTLAEDVVVRWGDGSVGGVGLLRPGRHARVDPREVIVSGP